MPDFGSSGSNDKTVTSTDPWGPAQPYLKDILGQAQGLYNSGQLSTPAAPFETVAPFNPTQLQAQAMGTARATNGSPLNGASSDYLTKVLNGSYLDSNPWNATLADRTKAQLTDQLSRVGGFGDNALTARAFAEGLAPVMNQNYQTERGYQQQAAGMAPQQAAQDWTDIGALSQIGGEQQTQQQALTNDQLQRYLQTQQNPMQALQNYLALVSGNLGSTQTTKAPSTAPSNAQLGVGAGLSLLGTAASLWG